MNIFFILSSVVLVIGSSVHGEVIDGPESFDSHEFPSRASAYNSTSTSGYGLSTPPRPGTTLYTPTRPDNALTTPDISPFLDDYAPAPNISTFLDASAAAAPAPDAAAPAKCTPGPPKYLIFSACASDEVSTSDGLSGSRFGTALQKELERGENGGKSCGPCCEVLKNVRNAVRESEKRWKMASEPMSGGCSGCGVRALLGWIINAVEQRVAPKPAPKQATPQMCASSRAVMDDVFPLSKAFPKT